MRFVLASTSSRRRDLLKVLGLPFEVHSPKNVDEEEVIPRGKQTLTTFRRAAGTLSRLKAESVASQLGDNTLVLGADTIVVLECEALGKPVDRTDAERMLKLLSGKSHHVITALTLIESNAMSTTESEITRVNFKPLSDKEIEGYIQSGEPMDKAGAYGIQGKGGLLVTNIEGCFYNVVGLPLARLYSMLLDFHVRVFSETEGAR